MSTPTRIAVDPDHERSAQPKRVEREATAPISDIGSMAGLLRHLQRTAGNQAVSRLLRQQAVQREGAPEEDEEEQPVQAKAEVGLEGGPLSPELAGRIRAKQGDGAGLDAGMQRQMEGAFDTSFGDVRVHSDHESHDLNRRISARAFTTGSDIFLGADANPDDTQLMAHELTHVVQQRGIGGEGRMVVGPAGDSHEQEAEAVSSIVARSTAQAPETRTAVSPLARSAEVRRAIEHIPLPTWGSALAPTKSYVNIIAFAAVEGHDATGASSDISGPLDFPPATNFFALNARTRTGTVSYNIVVSWHENNVLLDDIGTGVFRAHVPFTVNADGVLQWYGAVVDEQSSTGGGASLVVPVPVTTSATPSGGYVNVAPVVSGIESTTVGGGVGVGPFTATTPVTTTANTTNTLTRSFTVDLHPQVTPQTPVSISPPVHFKVNKASLEEGEEGRVAAWFLGFPPDVQAAVRDGSRSVQISGYASTTGRVHHNRTLSQQRAATAQNIVRGLSGSHADLNIFYFGEDAAHTPPETEDPNERRVDIVIQPHVPGTGGGR